jgi:transcriptional regulator with XRE-family HTH domain
MPSELGTYIRDKRLAAKLGLREFARMIGKSAPFLTQLELDDDPPPASEETLMAIAAALKENPDEFFARANKLPKALSPESALEVALYRRVKALSPADQRRQLEQMEQEKRSRKKP